MASGKFSFKPWRTLIRGDLKRFWPLWAGLCLLWFLLLPANLLSVWMRDGWLHESARYQILMLTYPAIFICGASGLAACLCTHSYLFSAKSSAAYHALPIRRASLWTANSLGGLAMLMIPCVFMAVTTFAACLLTGGGVQWYACGALLAVMAASCLFGYGLAAFCASISGNLAATVIFFALANAAAVVLWNLGCAFAELFCRGLVFRYETTWLIWLTPLWKLIMDCGPTSDHHGLWFVNQLWVYGLYALVGAGLLALGGTLYTRRHSEAAGDVIAAGWLRPVFRLGVCAVCGAGLTVICNLLYADGGRLPLGILALLLAVGCFVGWFGADMLLKKSWRVFTRKNALGCAAVFLLLVLTGGLVKADVLGSQRRVPQVDEIDGVAVDFLDGGWNADPAEAAALHRLILSSPEKDNVSGCPLRLIYKLTDGSLLERQYYLDVERQGRDDELTRALQDFLLSPQAVHDRLLGYDFSAQGVYLARYDIDLYRVNKDGETVYQNSEAYEVYGEDAVRLAQALEQDLLAGRYQDYGWLFDERSDDVGIPVNFYFDFHDPEGGVSAGSLHAYVDLLQGGGMTETLAVLKELGLDLTLLQAP